MVEPSYYQLILPFNSILIDVIPLYYQPNHHLDNYNTSHDNFNSPVHDDNHDSYMYFFFRIGLFWHVSWGLVQENCVSECLWMKK